KLEAARLRFRALRSLGAKQARELAHGLSLPALPSITPGCLLSLGRSRPRRSLPRAPFLDRPRLLRSTLRRPPVRHDSPPIVRLAVFRSCPRARAPWLIPGSRY